MVHELLLLMPSDAGRAATIIAIAGCALGAGLWLLGARYSRAMIALLAVAVGAVLGLMLPRWYGWAISTQATAVGGAVVLGLSGWLLHRVWVGMGLGLVLALWAALGTWIFYNDPAAGWSWPVVSVETTLFSFALESWSQVPEDIRRLLPYSCGAALITGLSATLLWPRLGVVLMYSCAGLSLLVGMGLAAIEFSRPQWLVHVPPQTWAQLTTLAGLVAFGAIVQWNAAPSTAGSRPAAHDGPPSDPALQEILRKPL